MHTEKQEIFDRYARSVGFENWKGLLVFTRTFKADKLQDHIYAACDLVQKEQQKRIAENSKIEHAIIIFGDEYPHSEKTFGNENEVFAVDKLSILSENNLIK